MKSLVLTAALLLGCGTQTNAQALDLAPEEPGLAECAVCGMVVREQPAPRGQVAFRDGTHQHYCSLGDLRASLDAPGPRGRPVQIWVERLPADFDPAAPAGPTLSWVEAENAHYVVGVERPAVMGQPVLSYGSVEEARQAATRLQGQAVAWETLRETAFHLVPGKER